MALTKIMLDRCTPNFLLGELGFALCKMDKSSCTILALYQYTTTVCIAKYFCACYGAYATDLTRNMLDSTLQHVQKY